MATQQSRIIDWQQVAKHNKDDDLWIVIGDHVYDVTNYSIQHPGGPIVLQNKGGRNATLAFDQASHSQAAKTQIMPKYKIGNINHESAIEEWQKQSQSSAPNLIVTVVFIALILSFVYFLAA